MVARVALWDAPGLVALYQSARRMSPYLMDRLRARLERPGVRAIVSAHAGSLPVAFLADVLGLDDGEPGAVLDRLRGHGCCLKAPAPEGGDVAPEVAPEGWRRWAVDVAATKRAWAQSQG